MRADQEIPVARANVPRKWWVLVAIGTGTFMSALDGSVVNAVLPVLRDQLRTDIATVEWVVTVYLLVVSGLLLGFGRLGDARGHRTVYLWGVGGFIASSALCGLAPSAEWLIAFRALQAISASMQFANSPAILTKTFPPQQRGQALGLQATMTYLGLTVGPSLGGRVHLLRRSARASARAEPGPRVGMVLARDAFAPRFIDRAARGLPAHRAARPEADARPLAVRPARLRRRHRQRGHQLRLRVRHPLPGSVLPDRRPRPGSRARRLAADRAAAGDDVRRAARRDHLRPDRDPHPGDGGDGAARARALPPLPLGGGDAPRARRRRARGLRPGDGDPHRAEQQCADGRGAAEPARDRGWRAGPRAQRRHGARGRSRRRHPDHRLAPGRQRRAGAGRRPGIRRDRRARGRRGARRWSGWRRRDRPR